MSMEFALHKPQRKLEWQTRTLEADLKELTRKHLDAEETVQQLRKTLRDLKHDGERRKRELELTKQTCDRVVHEKRKLQNRLREAEEERRSLEVRVERLSDARELKRKCDDVKGEMRELQRKLQGEEIELQRLKKAYDAQTKEVGILQRALSLKVQELSSKGGESIHARLLYAIAQGEEECVRLAGHLSELESECRRLKKDGETDKGERLVEEQEKTEVMRAEVETLEEECSEKHRRWQEAVKERDAMEQSRDVAKKEARDVQKKLELKESALQRQQREAHDAMKELRLALDRTKKDAEKESESSVMKAVEYKRTLKRKDDQIRCLKELLERRDALAQEQLANERRKREETSLKLKNERIAKRFEGDVPLKEEKNGHMVHLKDENDRLRGQLSCITDELKLLRSELSDSQRQSESLKQENKKLAAEKESLAGAKDRIQEALLDQIESVRARLRSVEMINHDTKPLPPPERSEIDVERSICGEALLLDSSDSAESLDL